MYAVYTYYCMQAKLGPVIWPTHAIEAFKVWCCRDMLKICVDKVRNEDTLKRIGGRPCLWNMLTQRTACAREQKSSPYDS